MDAVFCPLEVEWGNAAEIASAAIAFAALFVAVAATVVAFLGSIAIAFLGWNANRIADKPRELAAEAERREAEVLLVFVSGDIIGTLAKLRLLIDRMREPDFREYYANEERIREEVTHQIMNLQMITIAESLPRLHVLRAEWSHALARAMGLQRSLTHRAVANRPHPPSGRSYSQEFDYFLQWLNVMESDLDVVADVADYALRHGLPEVR